MIQHSPFGLVLATLSILKLFIVTSYVYMLYFTRYSTVDSVNVFYHVAIAGQHYFVDLLWIDTLYNNIIVDLRRLTASRIQKDCNYVLLQKIC